MRRTLYRYVDWNNMRLNKRFFPNSRTLYRYVDWNINLVIRPRLLYSRTLYRYVDWNKSCFFIWHTGDVVPYIGTWIETIGAGRRQKRAIGRTLYRYVDWNNTIRMSFVTPLSRTLYRYVDWNTDVDTIKIQGLVVPYIGTWIETDKTGIKHKKPFRRTLYRYVDWNRIVCKCNKKRCGRTLYRYVDWNYRGRRRWSWKMVVPYIGTWIETWDG